MKFFLAGLSGLVVGHLAELAGYPFLACLGFCLLTGAILELYVLVSTPVENND